jgi:hypothetical protein
MLERVGIAGWRNLAAGAWRAYLTHGRGAVVIRAEEVQAAEDSGQPAVIGREYSTADQLAQSAEHEELHRKVCEYEPTRAVVLLLLEGSLARAYTVEGDPPPPHAHALTAS